MKIFKVVAALMLLNIGSQILCGKRILENINMATSQSILM